VPRKIFQTYKCTRCHKLLHWYEGVTAGEYDAEMAKHARDEGVCSMEQYMALYEFVERG